MNGHDDPHGYDPTEEERQAADDDAALWADMMAQADEQPPAQVVADPDGSEWVNIPRAAYTRMVSPLAGLGWVEGWYYE